MMQTISDLWNGNLAPCEYCGAHDDTGNQLYHRMQLQEKKLRERLSASQNDFFQTYLDHSEDYLLRMMELAFIEGFRIGSNLTRETIFPVTGM